MFEIEKRANQQKDLVIYQRCKALQSVDHMRINTGDSITVEIVQSAIKMGKPIMHKLNVSKSSVEKINVFVRLGRALQELLKNDFGVETGADEIFPLILSIVIHSSPAHLCSHLQ